MRARFAIWTGLLFATGPLAALLRKPATYAFRHAGGYALLAFAVMYVWVAWLRYEINHPSQLRYASFISFDLGRVPIGWFFAPSIVVTIGVAAALRWREFYRGRNAAKLPPPRTSPL